MKIWISLTRIRLFNCDRISVMVKVVKKLTVSDQIQIKVDQ